MAQLRNQLWSSNHCHEDQLNLSSYGDMASRFSARLSSHSATPAATVKATSTAML